MRTAREFFFLATQTKRLCTFQILMRLAGFFLAYLSRNSNDGRFVCFLGVCVVSLKRQVFRTCIINNGGDQSFLLQIRQMSRGRICKTQETQTDGIAYFAICSRIPMIQCVCELTRR